MGFGINLLLFICMFPVHPIMYFVMKSQKEENDTLLYGIKIPKEHKQDDEVLRICKKYEKMHRRLGIALLFIPILPFFIPYFSIAFTIYMMWLLAVIVLLSVPYMLGNRAMKQLKIEKGWCLEKKKLFHVDTKVLVEEAPAINPRWFVASIVVSFIPVAYLLVQYTKGNAMIVDLAVGITMAAVTIVLYGCSAMVTRTRMRVISSDTTVNQILHHVRNYQWSKAFLTFAWINTAFTWLLTYHLYFETKGLYWIFIETILYILGALFVLLHAERTIRKQLARYDLDLENDSLDAEEDHWILGMFYYNPKDQRAMVEKRVGIGTTMNMAKPIAKPLMIFVLLVFLAIPVSCVWVMMEEFTPIQVDLVQNELIATHIQRDYVISIDDIRSITLIQELPHTYKKNGTGMANLLKGTFRVEGYGTCQLFLNPQNQEFIVVTDSRGTFLLSEETDEETLALYTDLTNAMDK